jgi:hypothetical protein
MPPSQNRERFHRPYEELFTYSLSDQKTVLTNVPLFQRCLWNPLCPQHWHPGRAPEGRAMRLVCSAQPWGQGAMRTVGHPCGSTLSHNADRRLLYI